MTSRLLGQPVFSVATQTFYWEDVVLAGALWGEWTALETSVAQGLACLKRLSATEKDLSPSAVEAAAADFRYERDLVAAADAEAWLARWGLSAEEWMSYIRRTLLQKRWADSVTGFAPKYPVNATEVAGAMHSEMVCSGAIKRVAKRLSARAAMHDYLTSRSEGWLDDETDVARETQRFPAGVAEHGLLGVSAERCRERLPIVARLETAFNYFRKAIMTPRAIHEHIGMHHLDWIWFSHPSLAFEREDMAREAALCLREDDMTLADVAASSRSQVREEQGFLEEIDRSLRDRFLGAREGEILGPVAVNGGYRLYHIASKRLPSADDPAVRERAEQSVLRSVAGYETRQRVRWLMTM
ncbi:MAG: hypothetical protein H0W30_16730 [Gemmatimonadaceae bacterium]|nr:hypothetical protein [Gemmatimonadaceae bacterium]MDQ3518239.1 hypothetical protein [Gemmatimonadota bacterium]